MEGGRRGGRQGVIQLLSRPRFRKSTQTRSLGEEWTAASALGWVEVGLRGAFSPCSGPLLHANDLCTTEKPEVGTFRPTGRCLSTGARRMRSASNAERVVCGWVRVWVVWACE